MAKEKICQSDGWLACTEQRRQKPGKCQWGEGIDMRVSNLSRHLVSKKRKERDGNGKENKVKNSLKTRVPEHRGSLAMKLYDTVIVDICHTFVQTQRVTNTKGEQ